MPKIWILTHKSTFLAGTIFIPTTNHCCCSVAKSHLTLRPHELQHARLPVLHYLPEFAQTHVYWVSDAIQLSHILSSPSPLALHLSQHWGLFPWLDSSHQVAKILSFSISPSNEYSGVISFRIDWFDVLVVQGTLKNFLQHHSLKTLILQCSALNCCYILKDIRGKDSSSFLNKKSQLPKSLCEVVISSDHTAYCQLIHSYSPLFSLSHFYWGSTILI